MHIFNKKVSGLFAITIILVVGSFLAFVVISENYDDSGVKGEYFQSGELATADRSPTYKVVTLSDGEIGFNFEIPKEWAAETRNSGERRMSDEEILDFLATNINYKGQNYSDMTDEELSKLTPEDLGREIKDFPNATVARVSGNGGIDYSDWNPDQIDINFLSDDAAEDEKKAIKEEARNFLDNNPYQRTFKWIWSMENVGGFEAETVTFPLGIDSAGQKNATVELTGGKLYFITLGDSGKALVIKKQGKGDSEFERDFEHLIYSLKFEN